MSSVVSSLNIENTDVQPLVPRFRVIFKDLMRIENDHCFLLLTSDLLSSPSKPPFSLSLPWTKEN